MFWNINDMLMLNDIYKNSAEWERHKMTEELINYKKFSSEEVKTIIDYSLNELKEPVKIKE